MLKHDDSKSRSQKIQVKYIGIFIINQKNKVECFLELIGLHTPESVKQSLSVEHYSLEISVFIKNGFANSKN
jgi:hypothetical protein